MTLLLQQRFILQLIASYANAISSTLNISQSTEKHTQKNEKPTNKKHNITWPRRKDQIQSYTT